jgi:hypothetical protein
MPMRSWEVFACGRGPLTGDLSPQPRLASDDQGGVSDAAVDPWPALGKAAY